MNPTPLGPLAELENLQVLRLALSWDPRLGFTHLYHLMKGTESVTEMLWPEITGRMTMTKTSVKMIVI